MKDYKGVKTFDELIEKEYGKIGTESRNEYEEPTKEQILQELKEAVVELGLIEQGKLKARPAKELLNEL